MSKKRDAIDFGSACLAALFEQEIAAIEERSVREDELMLRALQGEPFWATGLPVSDGDVVGLADYIPTERK